MLKKIFVILKEYGLVWSFNRVLYEVKLRVWRKCPRLHELFAKSYEIKRIDIFDVDVHSIKQFLNELSKAQKEDIISTADKAIDGIVEAYGKQEFNYGNPIDWQCNPLTGERCDESEKWFMIPDFSAKLGDIKNVWEASRFSYMYYYVRAYLLTEDNKYYLAFSNQLADWLKKNSYGKGANYKCGQECSIRMVNALIVYSAFHKLGLTDSQDEKNICELIVLMYKKIKSNFFYARHCVKIDHLIAETCGLITGAWCCGRENEVSKYGKLFLKEIRRQFSKDGIYLSYSFHYQRYVLEWVEYFYKISNRIHFVVDDVTEELIYKAARVLYNVSSREGFVPNYGSNDGTLIFKTTACEHNDFRPIINTIMSLTGHGKVFRDDVCDEEWLWFGNKGTKCTETEERRNIKKDIYTFENENYFLLVNSHNYKNRPAHMDQMHLDLWIDGINVFCDSGSYSYASEQGDLLTLTEAHNTVSVKGKPQFVRNGRFLTYGRPRVQINETEENVFDGTAEFFSGYSHRRKLNVEPKNVYIEDSVNIGKGTSEFEVLFHTPCDVKVDNGQITFWCQNELLCTMTSNARDVVIEDAERSTHYMTLEKIKCVRLLSDKQQCRTTITMRGK